MQNRAILRNALRKRNDELPSVSNDMQSGETLRNSLGLNYKSAVPLLYRDLRHGSLAKLFGQIRTLELRNSARIMQTL
jgi:hypothetical protein